MYYHIRVTIKTDDETDLDNFIKTVKRKAEQQGKLQLIRKFNKTKYQDEEGNWILFAEAWLDTQLVDEKQQIFDKFQTFVTNNGGVVDMHTCDHDNPNPQPCVIEQEWRA